jgi:hypothetical protein
VFIETNASSRVSLVSTTISGNSAGNAGGGVSNYTEDNGMLSLTNSTVSGNTADSAGGGMFSYTFIPTLSPGSSLVNLLNSTLSGNAASGMGGGLYSANLNGGNTVTLRSNLVAGNTATGNGDEVRRGGSGGSFTVNDHNLFGHDGVNTANALSGVTAGATDLLATSDGSTSTALTAILDTVLANNGGPTQTHDLVTGSPAIDAAGACLVATDQRGLSRPFNGDGSGGAVCDIGAVEFRP